MRETLGKASVGRTIAGVVGLVALCAIYGCTFTRAGKKAPPGEPPPSGLPARVEHTVGTFTFAWGEAEGVPASGEGRLLSREIMDAWKRRGYASEERFVSAGGFSGSADYNLTLSGTQRTTTSFFRELLNALTLTVLPYKVTGRYEIQCVLEDAKGGQKYSANAQGDESTYVSVLFLPALPWAYRGHNAMVQQISDALYEQFLGQGAFAPRPDPGLPLPGRPASSEMEGL